MEKKYNYVLGIDVGISSVGWGMLELDEDNNPYKIIAAGSRIFTPGEVAKTGASKAENRRLKRGARRIIRRREFRVDCVRHLLYNAGFLKGIVNENDFNKQSEELTDIFNNEIQKYYKDKNISPYQLKVEALNRKLTDTELNIILVHYAKHRGYKSNRDDDNAEKLKETGKVKSAIADNESIMKKNKYNTISEMFLKNEKFSDKIRNSNDNYKMTVTREMYLNEIEKVLDSQIKYGLINEDFKNKYIDVWSSQRHYSKGPGGNSQYGGDLILKMTGLCKFTNEPRAAKCNPSSELFVAISKLVNLRYKTSKDNEYQSLNSNQIKQIIYKGMNVDKITYNNIVSELQLEQVDFKGLELGKKDYIDVIKDFKIKVLKLDKDDKNYVDFSTLTEEEINKYNVMKDKKILSKTCFELKTYSIFRKKFTEVHKDLWEKEKYNLKMLDAIATILTNYKLNSDIIDEVNKNEYIDNNLAEFITSFPNCKDHIMISESLVLKLLDIMIDGVTYSDAMTKLDFQFNDVTGNHEKSDLLPSLSSEIKIRNQRVLHSLAETRKVINAIIKKYGLPKQINIETARELSKSRQERNDIEKQQKENYENNIKIKNIILELYPSKFSSVDRITSTDLLKYKLWQEQNEKCGYTQENISIDMLFDNNLVQIDHILPYSRTFNDNYLNKTLVLTKVNQDKKNKTPYEWFGKSNRWEEYKNFINSLNIPERKKDNYLLATLTPEIENEMREQNLNDTKYISKFLVSYIKSYLNVDSVQSYAGAITGKLRGMWGLNGLTHSLEASNYYIKRDSFEEIKKNRDTHLHHALDALVIASINHSLEMKVASYEKYKRFLIKNTKAGLEKLISEDLILTDDNQNNFYSDSGEMIEEKDIKNYVNDLIKSNYLVMQNGTYKLLFPQPFDNFAEDAKVFVYEQNKEILKNYIINTRKYSLDEINNIHPITPSIAKPKMSGRLHGETLYSAKYTLYGGYSSEEQFTTSRTDLNSSKIKIESLENILDAQAGSKEIVNTIIKWLNGYEDGAAAYKAQGYPINSKTGNKIKKVKIKSKYDGKGHFVNGAIVDKESIYKINVYTSKNTDDKKLYFIGFDLFDLNQIKKNNNFFVTLWYGQANSKINMKYSELKDNFDCYRELKTNQLVNITDNSNNSAIAYINGFTSGLLELKSCLGDGKDLCQKNGLFISERQRYQLTVSGIKSIELLNITVLGEVYGLQTNSN